MKTLQRQRGDGLVGILVAAIVFAVGIAAVMHLQGSLFQNSRAANARALAMNLGEETIETLRGFQVVGSSVVGEGFASIVTNAGVGISGGTVTRDNIVFTLGWTVTDYYSDAAGALTTTATEGVVQKRVIITVLWNDVGDAAGVPQLATLTTVINKVTATSATSVLASSLGGGGSKPDIPYIPSNSDRVTPIGVGTGAKRETLVPASVAGKGYASTEFRAYTYETAGSHILLRQEDFQTVACDCTFAASNGTASGPAYPEWNTSAGSYIDVEGESITKVTATATGNQQQEYCDICCQDHHDSVLVSQKYDPYRSVDDFDSSTGNHKHYNGTAAVTSGQYLESCRLKRVDGFWRVYQDWHMVALTVLPLSDLTAGITKGLYENYVKDVIDQHLDESKVAGETLATPPTKAPQLDHTLVDNYVVLGTIGATKELTARAIYLDFMYDTADNPHLSEVNAEKNAANDYLLHIPFYEVDVTDQSNWVSQNNSLVDVGNATSANLIAGEVEGMSTTGGIPVTGTIRISNSGIVSLNSAVDFNAATNPDSRTYDDVVSVSVVNSSTTTSTSTSTTTSSSTSTTTQATCTSLVSGKMDHPSHTATLTINENNVLTTFNCPSQGKNYSCPSQTLTLSGIQVFITSDLVVFEVTPYCGSQRVNF